MSKDNFKSHSLKSTFNITDIITILCLDLSANFRNTGETHDFWELVYVTRGSVNCYRERDLLRLEEGEIIFHRPGEFHSVECDGESSASLFIVTFKCRSVAMKYFCRRQFRLTPSQASLVKRITEESLSTFSVSEYPIHTLSCAPIGGEQLTKMYLEELLIRLMRSESGTDCGPDTDVVIENSLCEEICAYLKSRLDRRVSLDELSDAFHFGKSRLCDIFKKSKGDTIIHYHITLKMEEAKRLLREGKHTVFEISERLGFESPEYFSRLFKNEVGLSPTKFRATPSADKSLYLEKELYFTDK